MNIIALSEERDMETSYGYCNEYQPHAVRRMFNYKNEVLYDLRWDDAGNLGQVSMGRPGEMFEKGRFLFWTEDNRMHTAVDDKHYSYYAYDYGGERWLKLVGVNSSVDVNAEYMTAVSTLNEPTLYPSAYMVLTNKGYTKHYYAGTERVAARLGGGGLNALHHVIENDGELQTKAYILFKQSLEQVNSRVLNENDLECIMRNRFAKEEFGYRIDGTPYHTKADISFDHSQLNEIVNSMLDDLNHGEEKEVYFYHSDHLGSASWITDSIGIPIQHLQYLPYGEPYIDQRAAGTTYRERFRFTGKERDEETGYGYFGARYMDHELMTMWLSVDPMSDKYPSISPYAYCAWNPVKLVDPDGRKIKGVTYNPQTGEYSYTKAARRVGVDRYIEARCRTVSGRKSVQRMISSPTKFRIRVIDKPIVLPDGNGKVNQLSGIVLRGNYILISTADKVTVDEGKSGFDAVYVDGRNIVEENFKVKVSDLVSNPDESEFEEAYRLTEMEEFEKQYPYQTEEQKIHGIGAHEETHALDNGSEADALNNEKKERLEYIKEVLQ